MEYQYVVIIAVLIFIAVTLNSLYKLMCNHFKQVITRQAELQNDIYKELNSIKRELERQRKDD